MFEISILISKTSAVLILPEDRKEIAEKTFFAEQLGKERKSLLKKKKLTREKRWLLSCRCVELNWY